MPLSENSPEADQIIVDRILASPDRFVLDVGCGKGKWADLLYGKVKKLCGIEIWPDYVKEYKLREKYDFVFVMDVCDFSLFPLFQVVIFGDVLEHIPHDEALLLLRRLRKQEDLAIYLTIPIEGDRTQGAVYGNPYERHVYDWSDAELVNEGFTLLYSSWNPTHKVKIGSYEMVVGRKESRT